MLRELITYAKDVLLKLRKLIDISKNTTIQKFEENIQQQQRKRTENVTLYDFVSLFHSSSV